MTKSNAKQGDDSTLNPHLKEQDRGIIEAFAKEDHHVLTTTEISEHVSVSERTVRRRLDELDEEGVIGERVVSGVKLAWLEEEVTEPITVQYPLLRYVWDRTSIQLFLIGVATGIISVLILFAAMMSIGYDISIWFIESEQLLLYGVLAATVAALFIVIAVMFAAIGWLLRFLEMNAEDRLSRLRK